MVVNLLEGARRVIESKHQDPGVAARRVPLSISEAAVECDHKSLRFGRHSRDRWVVASGESFVPDGVHIVARCSKDDAALTGRFSSRLTLTPKRRLGTRHGPVRLREQQRLEHPRHRVSDTRR